MWELTYLYMAVVSFLIAVLFYQSKDGWLRIIMLFVYLTIAVSALLRLLFNNYTQSVGWTIGLSMDAVLTVLLIFIWNHKKRINK